MPPLIHHQPQTLGCHLQAPAILWFARVHASQAATNTGRSAAGIPPPGETGAAGGPRTGTATGMEEEAPSGRGETGRVTCT